MGNDAHTRTIAMPYGFTFSDAPEGRAYLVIGPQCWGKDVNLDRAVANAKKEGGADRKHWRFIVYDVDHASYVDDMGYIVSDIGVTPAREVCRYRMTPRTVRRVDVR
jgi:hypothetical protein